MTSSLVDVPRCLSLRAAYVGSPQAADGESPRGPWSRAVGRTGTTSYRRQATKECLDTAAVLRSYREPTDNESWLIPASSERRLLAQVNAIIALGPDALSQVVDAALDPDVPDPGRVFAALFVIGCVETTDWLERVRAVFSESVLRNVAEAAAAVEAFSLAPNPHISAFLTPFLTDERSRLRAAAIRILAFRRGLPEAEWLRALRDPDSAIVAAGLSASLRDYDPAVCERALDALFLNAENEFLTRLALRAGASLGVNTAHACALQIALRDPSWADAAHCLALFGYMGDARHIRELLFEPGAQFAIRAAATLGSVALVPDLLGLLHHEGGESERSAQVRLALAAITGLPFIDVADASHAMRLWSESASRFDPAIRFRLGRPLTGRTLLESLRSGPGSRTVRQNTYLELLAVTGGRAPHFSPYEFVRTQTESLDQIDRWLASSGC